jgi:hypothetical protein
MFKRQCSVCGHRARIAIDTELAEGIATREIASKFGLSKSAIARHAMSHVVDADDGSGDDAIKALLVSAQRALRRAESKNDHRAVLEALRLLSELGKRNRVSLAASTSPGVRPREPKRDVNWLVEELKRIYGIKKDRQPQSDDERLIGMLKARVMREDCEETIAAACTLAASLISGRPMDRESKTEVRRLLEVGDEVEIVGVVDDEVGEETGAECDGSDDGDDEPAERSDSEPE